MTDTAPEIAEMVRARLMARSGADRFLMGVRMCDAARCMVLASLPADFRSQSGNGSYLNVSI